MKLPFSKIAIRVLAAVVLVGAGVIIERATREPDQTAKNTPRYKATVRIVKEHASIADAPERINGAKAPEVLESVVKSLDLTNRWNLERVPASARLGGMIEAHVEATAPEVLVVTVRSSDKKEPDEIASTLVREMTRRARSPEPAPAPVQEFAENGIAAIAKQEVVLEDARARIAAILLSSIPNNPSPRLPEIRGRISAYQNLLRAMKNRDGGRDPAIPVSDDEKAEFREAMERIEQSRASDHLSGAELETLKLMNSPEVEAATLTDRRRGLQSRLEALMRETKQELEDETVPADCREAYAKAKQELETERQKLNLLKGRGPGPQ